MVGQISAQISEHGRPMSLCLKDLSQEVQVVNLPDINVSTLLAEDEQNNRKDRPFRFAIESEMDVITMESGSWEILPNGDKVWRLSFKAKSALSLHFVLKNFELPTGARMFFYSKDYKYQLGAFTAKNNSDSKTLATTIIPSNEVVIEYFQPNDASFDGTFSITKIYQGYRDMTGILGLKDSSFGSSGTCNVDINCPDGDNWQVEKRAVVRIFLGGGFCTGTIMNNTAEDATPYVLTANHCVDAGTDYSAIVFNFNYEVATCNSGVDPYPNFNDIPAISGSTLRATTDVNTDLDFCLVEMSSIPPQDYAPYYAGWDKSGTTPTSTVGIHHPSGDAKKICIDNDPPSTSTFNTCDPNTHWLCQQWDVGVTEPGSSGSALFDQNHRVIGDLSGGEAACGNEVNDLYQKLFHSWEDYPGNDKQLKPWLDPANTGQATLDGYNPYSGQGSITANFTASATSINAGGSVNFTDLSTGTPTSWTWSFPGGTPSSSNIQNPTNIVYSNAGTYDVTLTAAAGVDSDTKTITGYIVVNPVGVITANFSASATTITAGSSVSFSDITTGGTPTSWNWSFPGAVTTSSTAQNPTGIVYNNIGVYNVSLTVSDGTNSDTETKNSYINVVSAGMLSASFSATQTNITTDQTTSFIDESLGGIVSWKWTFTGGTPATSTQQNPSSVAYNTAGSYDVQLIVTDTTGDADTLTKATYINVTDPIEPIAFFSGTPLYIAVGDFVDFTDLTYNAPITWKWNFEGGSPATSTQQNPAGIVYNQVGTFDVELIVTNSAGGDTIKLTDYVTVVEPYAPVADFIASDVVITEDTIISFTDLSTNNPDTWTWYFEGAIPSSSTDQNPDSVAYGATGTFDVMLIVSNAYGTDTLLLVDYITVVPQDSIGANFIASELIIVEGDSINFTDLSVGSPDSWSWLFQGALPATSIDQNPQNILYSVAGTYTVQLAIARGNSADTLIREFYITVLPEGYTIPQADFYSPYTLIFPGTNIDFFDLSFDGPENWIWFFEGANPSFSVLQDPVSIEYNDLGCFDVTLIVWNELGADTIVKPDYICVIDPDSVVEQPLIDFEASERLIAVGQSIYFNDLSTNNPTGWSWTFEGGTPATSIEQNPANITYDTPGLYNVTLVVSNIFGQDSLTKTEYIVVSDTTWADPDGYCDTITNFDGPIHYFYNLDYTWGYFPGHNGDRIKAYADKFVHYTFSELNAVLLPIQIAKEGVDNSYIRVKVWEGEDYPDSIVTSKKVYIHDLYPNTYCLIEFDSLIPIDGEYFVGVELRYVTGEQDSVCLTMEGDRGPNGVNTMYLQDNGVWYTPNEYADTDVDREEVRMNTSLAIKLIGCLVGIDETEQISHEVTVFPNPTNGLTNVYLGETAGRNTEIELFNIMGERINLIQNKLGNNLYQFDMIGLPSGIYFVNVYFENEIVTKRISFVR